MKFRDYAIVLAEVPDEITIALDITSCPHKCKNCHSPWLREDSGELLTKDVLINLKKKYPGATCICFMGGDSDLKSILEFSKWIHAELKLKTALYSGNDGFYSELCKELDYYKAGSYREERGPLNNPNTNQVMIKREGNKLTDITYRFQQKPFM